MFDENKIENVSPAKMVGRVSPLTAVSICGALPSLHRPSAHQKSCKSFPLSHGGEGELKINPSTIIHPYA